MGLVWTCANSVCLSQMFGAPNIRRIKILTQEGVLIKKWSSFCQPLISWWYGQTITIPDIVWKGGGEGNPMAANDFLHLPSKGERYPYPINLSIWTKLVLGWWTVPTVILTNIHVMRYSIWLSLKKKMQISLQALYDATSTERQKMQKLNLTALTNIINMKNSYLTTL